MKRLKLLLASLMFVLALATPALISRTVRADQTTLQCPQRISQVLTYAPTLGSLFNPSTFIDPVCDLGINKTVNPSQTLPSGSIVWTIAVTNNSTGGLIPSGTVVVSDILPAGVIFDSYTTTDGSTYDKITGQWQFNAPSSSVTLTINTHPAVVGNHQNTASFSQYDPNSSCGGSCNFVLYKDGDSSNNSSTASVQVNDPPLPPSVGSPPPAPTPPPPSTTDKVKVLGDVTTADPSLTPPTTPSQPQVLAASTLSNTGSGIIESLIAAGLIVATLGTLTLSRLHQKRAIYRLFN